MKYEGAPVGIAQTCPRDHSSHSRSSWASESRARSNTPFRSASFNQVVASICWLGGTPTRGTRDLAGVLTCFLCRVEEADDHPKPPHAGQTAKQVDLPAVVIRSCRRRNCQHFDHVREQVRSERVTHD